MNKVIQLVKTKHSSQKRKYTNEEYFVHLESVAKLVEENLKDPKLIAIAYCHDLFEDTNCTEEELNKVLKEENYTSDDIKYILDGVKSLTDVYVSTNYPELNRKARKEKENERLSKILPEYQSVKYCDIIDNCKSIFEHDREGFWKIYKEEMLALVGLMDKADLKLREKVIRKLNAS